MRFTELLDGVPGLVSVNGDVEICCACVDSRKATPGSVFICMPGAKQNSHSFIPAALQAGAVAVIGTDANALSGLSVPSALVTDSVDACWRVCKKLYGDPSAKLKLVGVTGTNGKTTVAWILAQMLQNMGTASAYMGTLGARIGTRAIQTELTTPFSPDINSALATFVENNVGTAVLEISSHALAQRRADGLEFDVAIFTHLSQDHLDFHADLEDYFHAKRRLFADLPSKKNMKAVINADDAFGRRLLQEGTNKISFGRGEADVKLQNSSVGLDHLSGSFRYKGSDYGFEAGLGGEFNIDNCLAAIAAAIALGNSPEESARALKGVKPAPGRFESVPNDANFKVIVDYAHTPDALEKLLSSVRSLTKGRVITVFGCGGDRDKNKRPKMGAAASRLSDVVYLTSDNPRTEAPEKIIEDILPGIIAGKEIHVNPDRRASIFEAIRNAKPDDTVVIAGKGHENYQIIGTTKYPFDDREIATQAIGERTACV